MSASTDSGIMAKSVPVIDFSAIFGDDEAAKDVVVQQVGQACQKSGFFQLINHGIPHALQKELLQSCEEFFSLPLEIKETYNKGTSPPAMNSGVSVEAQLIPASQITAASIGDTSD